jgi:uroporphyrinogen-III synthase
VNDGPLAGCGVLITRPAHQAEDLAVAIEAAGGLAVRFPVLTIAGRDSADIERDFAALATPDIVVFVSANAVAHGLAAVRNSRPRIAVVGPSTRAAVEALGVSVDIVPDDAYDSEQLLLHPDLQDVRGRNVLIVRGQSGRNLLAEMLRERGAQVDYLCVYHRLPYTPAAAELEVLDLHLRAGSLHFAVLMSVETIERLVEILPPLSLDLLRQTTLVAPSARVLQTASALLPGYSTVLAPGPQAPAIVDTLCRQWQNGTKS